MKKALLIILLVLFQINLLQAGPWQNPDAEGWVTVDSLDIHKDVNLLFYYDICCLDSLNCIAYAKTRINPDVLIRKSTDGGKQWFTIKHISGSLEFPLIWSIAYPKKNLILAACDSGLVLRSTDGGSEWEEVKIPLEKFYHGAITLEMLNDTGFIFYAAVGYYKTTNGGGTWKKLDPKLSPGVEFVNAIKIIDSNYCLMQGYDNSTSPSVYRYYYSTDMGETFIHYLTVPMEKSAWGFFINKDIRLRVENEFIKKDTAFPYLKLYQQSIIKTYDGGKNWEKIFTDDGLYYDYQIFLPRHFITEKIGVAARSRYIYLTNDSGYTWKKIHIKFDGLPDNVLIHDAKFISPKRLLVTCDSRILMYDMNSTGVDDDNEKDKLNIYPNPATDYVRIENTQAKEIYIYDVLGRQYPVKKVSENAGGVTLDTGTLEPGTYFITVQGKTSVQAVPLVVVR